jgi:hypothetical protein
VAGFAVVLLFSQACTSSDGKTDGGEEGGEISSVVCGATAAPIQAEDPLKLTGVVVTYSETTQTAPVEGVSIELRSVVDDAILAGPIVTGAAGAFAFEIATNGQPIEGYLKYSKAGFVTTQRYFERRWINLLTRLPQVDLIPIADADDRAVAAGATRQADLALLDVAVLDCEHKAFIGSKLTLNPAGGVLAYEDTNYWPDPKLTGMTDSGYAMVLNVPAATTGTPMELSFSEPGSAPFLVRSVKVFPGTRVLAEFLTKR